MKMLYFAFLLSVLNIVSSTTLHEHISIIRPRLSDHAQACLEDYPLSDDDLAAFKSGQFPEGDDAACLGACVLRKIGLFDDVGSLVQVEALDKAKEIFIGDGEIDVINQIISDCSKVNDEVVNDGEKGCERARLLFSCFDESK
uniref:Putative odorant binding protein 3 n=1 Tax=Corcyra cephalonica TaxID=139036 RepID=A0A8K1UB99_CORCP|nr:putative odorant binding protein 3 [Corcyra cephalonica]